MIDAKRRQTIDTLLHVLGISPVAHPNSYELYHQALTHSSYTHETEQSYLKSYERLEFLGDAVLKLIISEYLFERFPYYREGDLTKIRSVIVSDAQLAQLAELIDLGQTLVLGASERKAGGHKKQSVLACALEAFLGALFLDGKLADARHWLCTALEDMVTQVDLNKTKDNFKAVLQEWTQSQGIGLPIYRTAKESGPAHNRTFTIEVLIHHELMGVGTGKSKKEAQQQAARLALIALGELEDDWQEPSLSPSEQPD